MLHNKRDSAHVCIYMIYTAARVYEADRKRNYRILIGGHRQFVPNAHT